MGWKLGNNYADNIEQAEFLKGPTSILFGKLSLAE
jgi:outer membrane receptor protein involved in Fe transport